MPYLASVNPVDAQTCFVRLSVRWPVATRFASTGSRRDQPLSSAPPHPASGAPTRRQAEEIHVALGEDAWRCMQPHDCHRTTQSSCWTLRTCSAVVVLLALPDLPERKPVSPGLACGAFLFHDPCLSHLPEVIADRALRNLQPASGLQRRLKTLIECSRNGGCLPQLVWRWRRCPAPSREP